MIDNNTMLVQLTVGQLRDIIDERVQSAIAAVPQPHDPDPLGPLEHGLKNLAALLGVSVPYASLIVKDGKYRGAIIRREGSRQIHFYPKILKQLLKEESQLTI